MTKRETIHYGNDASFIASLSRSLLAVLGAKSAVVCDGHISLHAPSDEAVRTFAAEHGVEVREHVGRIRFLMCEVAADGYVVAISGPQTTVEQTAEVSP